jgi:type IV pilus assembly protein PilC
MSSESFTYKGISDGRYVEGEIDALNLEEASYKLKEQKVIITNLAKAKKKKAATKEKKKGGGFSFGEKKSKPYRCYDVFKTICNYG